MLPGYIKLIIILIISWAFSELPQTCFKKEAFLLGVLQNGLINPFTPRPILSWRYKYSLKLFVWEWNPVLLIFKFKFFCNLLLFVDYDFTKEFSILRREGFIGVPGLIIFYHFIICNLTPYDNFSSLSSFKKFLRATYFTLLDTTYNIDMPCTWFLSRNCPCHRS